MFGNSVLNVLLYFGIGIVKKKTPKWKKSNEI